MKLIIRIAAALVVIPCAWAAKLIVSAESAAQDWLSAHGHAPGLDELAELKGTNPEAFAIVQALLTKQAMGLIKRNHHGSATSSSEPMPEEPVEVSAPAPAVMMAASPFNDPNIPPAIPVDSPLEIPEPKLLAAAPAAVVAQGPPPAALALAGPPAPEQLPELIPPEPTAPPAMPPPTPLSPELPPALPDLETLAASPAPAAVMDESSPLHEALMAANAAHPAMSAAATRSSVSSSVSSGVSGGHSWLNWNPDQMIADNERMVQNVLGAVAQLTGKRTPRAAPMQRESQESPLAKDDMSDAAAQDTAEQDSRPAAPEAVRQLSVAKPHVAKTRAVPQKAKAAAQAAAAVAEAPKAQSAADLYLASSGSPEQRERDANDQSPDQEVAAHLPETVSWSNPYTFAASANSNGASPESQNSYLKDIDLGGPPIRVPHKSPDSENPYLQGLGLSSSSAPAQASIDANSLGAMHQSQLLSSHRLLSAAEDADWSDAPQQPSRKAVVQKRPQAPKDHLSGFLGSNKPQPAKHKAAAPRNPYLGKLDGGKTAAAAASYSPTSVLASNIEKANPYLQALDEPIAVPVQDVTEGASSLPSSKKADARDKLASFRWDDARTEPGSSMQDTHQLSMASSKVQNTAAVRTAVAKKKGKKRALSGWLRGNSGEKVVDEKAQRLQQQIAQHVADAKNPYLKGLDIDADLPKPQMHQEGTNPYMASFN